MVKEASFRPFPAISMCARGVDMRSTYVAMQTAMSWLDSSGNTMRIGSRSRDAVLWRTLGCESRVAASKGTPSRLCWRGSGACASGPEEDLLPRPRAPPRLRPRPLLRSACFLHLSMGCFSISQYRKCTLPIRRVHLLGIGKAPPSKHTMTDPVHPAPRAQQQEKPSRTHCHLCILARQA